MLWTCSGCSWICTVVLAACLSFSHKTKVATFLIPTQVFAPRRKTSHLDGNTQNLPNSCCFSHSNHTQCCKILQSETDCERERRGRSLNICQQNQTTRRKAKKRHNNNHPHRRSVLRSTTAAAAATITFSSIVSPESLLTSSSSPTSSRALAADKWDPSTTIETGTRTPFSTRRKYQVIDSPGIESSSQSLASSSSSLESCPLRVLLVSDSSARVARVALSIGDAGQFAEPEYLPGLAHLMEHMALSSAGGADFEDWLVNHDGSSNAFTAHGLVCFHYDCPPEVLPTSLGRFASLFQPSSVRNVCLNARDVIAREIGRVDSEFDKSNADDAMRYYYLLKHFCASIDHPFKRLSAGTLESLRTTPEERGIDIGKELWKFFQESYLASNAILVVIGPSDLKSTERWVAEAGFSSALSQANSGDGGLSLYDDSHVQERESLRVRLPFWGSLSDVLSSETSHSKQQQQQHHQEPKSSNLQIVMLSSQADPQYNEDIQKISFTWTVDLNYNGRGSSEYDYIGQQKAFNAPQSSHAVTAPAVAFVLAQLLARRGPGSLYRFFLDREWVPSGTRGTPRFTLPVDVSGFQLLKMELCLTTLGFANRSGVIKAVYKSIGSISRSSSGASSSSLVTETTISGTPITVPRGLIAQCVTVGTLHGFTEAPRPSDAVELAVDGQTFGLGGQYGVGIPGVWPLLPSVDDRCGMEDLRRAVESVLSIMCDRSRVVVIVTASAKAVEETFGWPSSLSRGMFTDITLPPPSSGMWKVEPVTGAEFIVESDLYFDAGWQRRKGFVSAVEPFALLMNRFNRNDDEELGPPVRNPLVPHRLRPARPILARLGRDGRRRYFYRDIIVGGNSGGVAPDNENAFLKLSDTGWGVSGESTWREFVTRSPSEQADIQQAVRGNVEERALAVRVSGVEEEEWSLWQAAQISNEPISLPLPLVAPEPSGRCSFMLQLVSNRPSIATLKQAAHAELWLNSFDEAVIGLAELGATAGIAYETSFNQFGLRICFRGISQSLPSYGRRFCRRLVHHHEKLKQGKAALTESTVNLVTSRAMKLSSLPNNRRSQLVQKIREATARDAAEEGRAFLTSCRGGLSLAQGDLLPHEAIQLLNDFEGIFSPFGQQQRRKQELEVEVPPRPQLRNILYRPIWKPRSSSPCYIPGVCLLSDACGRIQR